MKEKDIFSASHSSPENDAGQKTKSKGTAKTGPERLLPHHLGGEKIVEHVSGESAEERYKEREKVLSRAPLLETLLKAKAKEKNIEISATVNLSLSIIQEFERHVSDAQDLRKVTQGAKDPKEKKLAAELYGQKKKQIDEYLALGPSFEHGYREYIRAKNEFVNFTSALRKIAQLEDELKKPTFMSAPPTPLEEKKLKGEPLSRLEETKRKREKTKREMAESRLEAVSRETKAKSMADKKALGITLEALKTVYGETSAEYKELKKELTQPDEKEHRTKKETEKELEELRKKATDLWKIDMVRYLWQKKNIDGLLSSFAAGEDVIETPSVIHVLNSLHEWEEEHQRTTIGGVLVGPPGVGKTTSVRHYLEAKGRGYVYIDLSEDVTRYMLYGSKSLEFKSPSEQYEMLAKKLETLSGENFKKFIIENSKLLQSTLGVKSDEASVVFLVQLEEELKKGKSADISPERINELQQKITSLAEGAFRKELASDFAHIVKRNGWRDGVIIAALRRGDSIILDEFNKNKNWSLLYGLMTAKPGEEWYFADNDERIKISDNWRMYFTANIGRKHGGFEVAEALASRASGKVLEVDYPETKEEMTLGLAALSDPQGEFLRPKEDLAKLLVLINDVFPGIRKLIEDKRQSISISYRTIRDIGEKLVMQRDPKTKKPLYKKSAKSFDEAVYEVLVKSYPIYEDQTIPKEIVNLCTSTGLLLHESVAPQVKKWIGEDVYNERKEKFLKHKEDFNEIVKKVRGLSADSMDTTFPVSRKF